MSLTKYTPGLASRKVVPSSSLVLLFLVLVLSLSNTTM